MFQRGVQRIFGRSLERFRGIPPLHVFWGGRRFPKEYMDPLYSALATLPALESLILSNGGLHTRPEDESALANPDSLTELLRVPSLRSVEFSRFCFTSALCRATANALMDGTAITDLDFSGCSLPAGECAAMMANGFSRNTSVTHINVDSPLDQGLYSALTTALPSNSTLRDLFLSVSRIDDDPDLSPVVLALGRNTGLKSLTLLSCGSMSESLSIAMRDGLGMNVTLESLDLYLSNDTVCDENSAMWCRAVSFLRTNKALKSLKVSFPESCVSTLYRHIAAMLQENASLESLSIRDNWNRIQCNAEEYFVLITALQHTRTLKSLHLEGCGSRTLTHDDNKQMAELLKKNYGLERLPQFYRKYLAEDVDAILRLNEAGRRYLVQDGSSISKGVEVLSRVNKDINCVFLHLLENPRLCDRSTVEKVSAGESKGRSTNPTAASDGGKREQASVYKGRESRRRLA
jgi:hypothetical protein